MITATMKQATPAKHRINGFSVLCEVDRATGETVRETVLVEDTNDVTACVAACQAVADAYPGFRRRVWVRCDRVIFADVSDCFRGSVPGTFFAD